MKRLFVIACLLGMAVTFRTGAATAPVDNDNLVQRAATELPYNSIRVEWNGWNWEFVSDFPITTALTITCYTYDYPGGGPSEMEDWLFEEGYQRWPASDTPYTFKIIRITPESDAYYQYTIAQ